MMKQKHSTELCAKHYDKNINNYNADKHVLRCYIKVKGDLRWKHEVPLINLPLHAKSLCMTH